MSTSPEAGSDPVTQTQPRIQLSESAADRIREMLQEEGLTEEGGLRISARLGAGCSTPLQFGLVLEPEPEPDDAVLEGPGIRIFLDPSSAWSLDGLRVDYVDSPVLGSGFAFQHPRGKGGRAC
jgi:iron-sulfur cluster assembly accessory protein